MVEPTGYVNARAAYMLFIKELSRTPFLEYVYD